MSRYNVLAISHSFIVDTNREIWNSLAQKEDVDVDLICPDHWKSNLIKDLFFKFNKETDQDFNQVYPTSVYFKGNASFFFFKLLPLIKILRTKKYDKILLAQETWSLSLFMLTLCKLFTCNRSTPIDLWVCQNIKKQHLYWMRFWERFNTAHVRYVLHCCDEIKDVIEWKEIQKECRYFPFSFNPQNYLENYEIRLNDQKQRPMTLGHLGRLSEEKGIDQLLQAVDTLQKENEKLHFKIAGGGQLATEVEQFCTQHPRREYLGLLKHNEAHLFYRDIDVFLLTSQTRRFWKEQFGRVIIEAISSGCHFVGSNSGAIPEVMGKMDSPHNYDESSLEDLLNKTRSAVADIEKTDQYQTQRHNRHEKAMNTFSHQAVADLYYRYLVEGQR